MENRIIKFKAKDVRGKWVEGDLCHNLTGGLSILGYKEENGMGCFSGCHTIDPSTVCQFTGLKDKDGKEVWEHDIVTNYIIYRGEVVYENGGFCIKQNDKIYRGYSLSELNWYLHKGKERVLKLKKSWFQVRQKGRREMKLIRK